MEGPNSKDEIGLYYEEIDEILREIGYKYSEDIKIQFQKHPEGSGPCAEQ